MKSKIYALFIEKSLKFSRLNLTIYEIIFVDDGSQDGSREIILDLGKNDPAVKGIFFRRNFGQTAAMSAGIDYSGKELIFFDGCRPTKRSPRYTGNGGEN